MQVIHTTNAPAAIGTYSQAIQVGQTVYLSGQIPLDPTTMDIGSLDIRAQVVQVIKNISAVAEAAGGSLQSIVKLTVYLVDLVHFPVVNDVMSEYFSEPYPARVAIGVAALPRQSLVEMDAILVLPS